MDRPNILLFLTDDHGQWANGCYGNSELQTPNLDRLAAEGARFADAFTPCPVCSPARACLLTGRTPSQVGIHDWLQEAEPVIGDFDWLAGEETLPQLLSRAGYHCGLSGKWHMSRSHCTPPGFDWAFGLPRWQGEHNGPYTYHLNGQPLELEGNKSALITDHALQFLDDAPSDQPFFLNVGYIATHSPYQAETHDPDLTARFEDAAFTDIPPYHPHPWQRNEGLAGGFQPTDQQIRSRYIGYYTAVTEIDREVGRLLRRLEQGRHAGQHHRYLHIRSRLFSRAKWLLGQRQQHPTSEYVRNFNPRPPDDPRPGPGTCRTGQRALRRSLRYLPRYL